MISHIHKCIFIHIPATAGSAIEQAIVGQDWQMIDHRTKHLNGELAKLYYSKYWDDYFKFTIVRNPFDWMVSMYSKNRPEDLKGMSFKDFLKLIDRFNSLSWECPLNRIDIPLYKNLNELDFIGRFENLELSYKIIASQLDISLDLSKIKLHSNKRDKDYKKYYTEENKKLVEEIFSTDLKIFKYQF